MSSAIYDQGGRPVLSRFRHRLLRAFVIEVESAAPRKPMVSVYALSLGFVQSSSDLTVREYLLVNFPVSAFLSGPFLSHKVLLTTSASATIAKREPVPDYLGVDHDAMCVQHRLEENSVYAMNYTLC